jgi:hypothetical protein
VALTRFRVDLAEAVPTPSWTAWKQWESGLLTVHDNHADFAGKRGTRLVIADVVDVTQPSRRELYQTPDIGWMSHTWIRVRYVVSGRTHTVFLNEPGRLGLGHYLNHKPLRRALDSLLKGGAHE